MAATAKACIDPSIECPVFFPRLGARGDSPACGLVMFVFGLFGGFPDWLLGLPYGWLKMKDSGLRGLWSCCQLPRCHVRAFV